MIGKNISKKRENLFRNSRPEIGQRIGPTLSVIIKKPKSFKRWNFTPYLPAVEATLWQNFSSLVLFWGKIFTVSQKVSGNSATNCSIILIAALLYFRFYPFCLF